MWLTLAARLLRLYVGSPVPSVELSRLVQFIVGHYTPVWFRIRKNRSCSAGASNLYRSVELLRELPVDVQHTVRPVIQRNAFWAHPEQMLLGNVTDPDQSVRERAVSLIRTARQQETADVRGFSLPTVQFTASSYTDLITDQLERAPCDAAAAPVPSP